MPYSAEINSANPTCFLFLLDQSKSMLGLIAGGSGRTKAEAVTDALNSLLYNLCLRCVAGQDVRNRFYVGVIGYGQRIAPGLGGALAARDLVPVREVVQSPLRLGGQDPAKESRRSPVWVEPVAQGKTPMCATMKQAATILTRFLGQHPDCFPPVVINLTDGEATDGDPEGVAAELRQLSTTDGNVLLFNAHTSSEGEGAVRFPDTEAVLRDRYARQLFRMSSVLPPPMRDEAGQMGFATSPSTRGFAFNANLDSLVQFLSIGTTVLRTVAPSGSL
jgi:hypothetical protein